MQCVRTQQQLDAATRDTAILGRHGVPCELLSRAGGIQREPALARVRDTFIGGLRLPGP